jgi:hypothetical protein
VDRLGDDLARAYDKGVQAPGKEIHFLVLIAFLLSFGFIRTGGAHRAPRCSSRSRWSAPASRSSAS